MTPNGDKLLPAATEAGVSCPWCKGTGKLDASASSLANLTDCGLCGGTGRILDITDDEADAPLVVRVAE